MSKADRMFEELRGSKSEGATLIFGRFDGQYRGRNCRAIWRQIYPICIEGYYSMPAAERRAAQQQLRDRVRWRRRIRRRRYKGGKGQP